MKSNCYLAVICITFLLAACSSKPLYPVEFQAGFQFEQIDTYSLFERESPFYQSQNLPAALRNRIELSIERNMERRGLRYISINKSDVIVSYFYVSGSQRELKNYNRAVRFCSSCQLPKRHPLLGEQFEKGSVIVDLLDTKSQRSVWRGLAHVSNRDMKTTHKHENALNEALTNVFSQFPPKLTKAI